MSFPSTASYQTAFFVPQSTTTPGILWVSTSGNDATGTRGRLDLPFREPRAAEDAAQSGDTVIVLPGDYYVTQAFNGSPNVTIQGSPGARLFNNVIATPLWDVEDTAFNITGYFEFYGESQLAVFNTYTGTCQCKRWDWSGEMVVIEGGTNTFITDVFFGDGRWNGGTTTFIAREFWDSMYISAFSGTLYYKVTQHTREAPGQGPVVIESGNQGVLTIDTCNFYAPEGDYSISAAGATTIFAVGVSHANEPTNNITVNPPGGLLIDL